MLSSVGLTVILILIIFYSDVCLFSAFLHDSELFVVLCLLTSLNVLILMMHCRVKIRLCSSMHCLHCIEGESEVWRL